MSERKPCERDAAESKSGLPVANSGPGLMGPALPATTGRTAVPSVKFEAGRGNAPASHQPVAVAFSPPHGDGGRRPGWRGGSVAWERSDGFAPALHDRRADPGAMRRGFFDEARPNQYAAFTAAFAFAVVVALRWVERSAPKLVEAPQSVRKTPGGGYPKDFTVYVDGG